jgi:hypothetical protein
MTETLEQLQQNVRDAQAKLDEAQAVADEARRVEYRTRNQAALDNILASPDSRFISETDRGGVAPYILPFERGDMFNPMDPTTSPFGQDWLAFDAAYIMSKPERTRPTRVFVSSGLLSESWNIGNTWECRHDQTGTKLGDYTVVGIVFYDADGNVARTVGNVPDRKLAPAVFK